MKFRVLLTAKVLLSSFLLFYLFSEVVDIRRVGSVLVTIELPWLSAAIASASSGVLLSAFRWHQVLVAAHAPVKFSKLMCFYLEGMFYNFFLPGSIGGDGIKIWRVTRRAEDRRSIVAASVVVDRLIGVLALLAVALISLMVGAEHLPREQMQLMILACLVLMSILGFLILNASRSWFRVDEQKCSRLAFLTVKAQALLKSINLLRGAVCQTSVFPKVCAISLAFIILAQSGTMYALLRGVGLTPSFWFVVGVMSVASLILLLPVSIGGVGVRESIYLVMLTPAGVTSEQVIAISFAGVVINVLLATIGYFLTQKFS